MLPRLGEAVPALLMPQTRLDALSLFGQMALGKGSHIPNGRYWARVHGRMLWYEPEECFGVFRVWQRALISQLLGLSQGEALCILPAGITCSERGMKRRCYSTPHMGRHERP